MREDMTNKIILTNQSVIPIPEPGIALGTADSGGYTVQPALAGPLSTKKEIINTTHEQKKNQYDSIFRKGDAISRAPICNGINRLANVPLSPAVSTKKTMIVPWIVTKAK